MPPSVLPRASSAADVPARRGLRRATAEPVPYDFRRPIQLSREHARMLQVGFDGFARQATTVFTSSLRTVCTVSLVSVEQRTYAEYVDSLDATTYLTRFSAEPMHQPGILEIPLRATMTCLDHMLGGPGLEAQPSRPLTDIESGVLATLVGRLLGEMRYSLSGVLPLEPQVAGVEYSPQLAQVAGATDVMVVATLELRINERTFPVTVCLPFTGLLPHLVRAAAPAPVSERERAQRARAAAQLQARFSQVPVEVAVRLRPATLAPDRIADLVIGDVVRLGHPSAAPLEVVVDDTTFAHATAGTRGTRLAALIVGAPAGPSSGPSSGRPTGDPLRPLEETR